ncbi:hypothetical protein GCM10025883_06620 [Mobilicoccus caccae]|uniref:Uncharacterized protein n=1 Tax=Mobilicoccus caccae TaxID=1859295 RepID=A0ABQ6IPH6_9MICO|nr:hypothetical protein GCM10025883_06620 [Mobilicoccus caccae]
MDVDAGVGAQPVTDLDLLVRGVVIHHQVQLAVGVGLGDLLEEGQELLVAMPGLAGRGDLPRGDLQCREQGRRPVPAVVVCATLEPVKLSV